MLILRTARLLVAGIMLAALVSPATAAEQTWRHRPSSAQTVSREDVAAEIIFGRNVSARLLGQYRLYHKKDLEEYVTLVGRSLALYAPRPGLTFRFAVLDTDEVASYAGPGGYVFITRGALMLMADESELAGVLAHEIAHVVEQHIVNKLNIRGSEESMVSAFAQVLGGGAHTGGAASPHAIDEAMTILRKHGYASNEERQAFKTAMLLCALTGYDPNGLIRYLQRVATRAKAHTLVIRSAKPGVTEQVIWLENSIAHWGLGEGNDKRRKSRFAAAVRDMHRGSPSSR